MNASSPSSNRAIVSGSRHSSDFRKASGTIVMLLSSHLLVTLFLCSTCSAVSPTVYYVDSLNGSDLNEGTSVDHAFSTIKKCVDVIESPGDECRIRRGRYHETITISGKHGTPANPIIIAGYRDERPIIDGTTLLKPAWTRHKGRIFKAVIDSDIWQLFVDDVMMTNARWPNALWSDFTVFNNSYWAKSALNSTRDKMIDNGEKNLARSGINATAALAVLNIGSFNTFVAKVQHHVPGTNSFTYKNTFGDHHFRPKLNQYFLEDKLELLDQPGEWFYNKQTKTVYVWTSDGRNPKRKVVRGKNQTYAFQISDCHNMILANMTFFATTLKAQVISRKNYIDQLEFQSINFSYPSYSRRMLGSTDPPQWTQILGKRGNTMRTFKVFNCTFYGTDGAALQYTGINVTLENNLFERNDWSGAMMKTAMGGLGTIVSKSTGDRFIRNTVRFNGASAGYRIGAPKALVLLNHFHHQCWGKIQNDGSHVQVQSVGQTGAVLKQNWIHDSPKYALRFDGDPPRIGRHGTMMQNVAWHTSALMVKGDYQQVYNNLAFDKYLDKGGDHQGNGCVLCVLKYVRSNPVAINNNSVVMYNAATTANGGKYKKKTFPLAGRVIKENVFGKVRGQLMDADNWDFRPSANSKYIPNGVGPYKYDPSSNYYWIPGRQLYKTSTPVPLDSSTTVKPNRDVLMWLNALGAQTHHVYFGQNHIRVTKASVKDPEYKATIQDGGNVYLLNEKLKPESKYYWRVDAEISEHEMYQGDVWSFTTTG